MNIRFLGKGGSDKAGCPSLYATDQDSYIVQGWQTPTAGTVEIPHLLPGFAEEGSFIAATMTDTGRGTFRLTGRPIVEGAVLGKLTLEDNETAIEVPRAERTYYGGTPLG
ncbi:hypothetical protein ACFWPH_00375 [Nocardia sp. NPDC058499]|uniref:hypothetical protein n=1 Tax=Nocardia sp. NPDC058499 TaxID=3346530 RepID=UPI00365E8F5E